MGTSKDYAPKVLRQCDRLATISEEPERLTRLFATPALARAGEAVLGWMRDLGMAAADPWMGMFRAMRRPACWMFLSAFRSSGT